MINSVHKNMITFFLEAENTISEIWLFVQQIQEHAAVACAARQLGWKLVGNSSVFLSLISKQSTTWSQEVDILRNKIYLGILEE